MKKLLKEIINKKFLNKFGYKVCRSNVGEVVEVIEEMTSEENLLLETCLKYSMTTKTRMWSLLNSINYIHNYNIPGDFVECGVWKGGNLILYQLLNQKKILNRNIYGFDTFEGMPLPGKFDFKSNGRSALDLYNIITKSNGSGS